jgi:uncharacterized protein DUF4386
MASYEAVLNGWTLETSPRSKARIAGLLYLIVIVGGFFAEVIVRGKLVVHGDPAATAHNIMAHEMLYRWGFVVELLYLVCNLPLALLLYNLFKVVSRTVALLDLGFGLLSTVIEAVSLLGHYAPLLFLNGGDHLSAFTPEQLQAASYVSIQLFEHGFAIALVFFGFDCFAMAYLIVRSTFFPRIIGVLLGIEGVFYLVNSFANFLSPAVADRVFPFLAASAIAEILFCLWLLVMGVNEKRWKEQAREAGFVVQ